LDERAFSQQGRDKVQVNRAEERAYEILVQRGLYPFEFRITISAEELRANSPYTVRIKTANRDLLVEMPGVPFDYVKKCGEPGSRDFDRVIDTLLTALLAKMRQPRPSVRQL
jgi:hypothetical protein